ncbi:uncharacterized protein DNG_08764 [Cephalotrichum gorgonifer]|uniref:Geranylgeranyl pyrophosphate synthetase n=1 Tax=Cephalotrichum gorgonifer TaxID=2041049 RepID=A0AAE8SYN6_9PEZI|nr:uncharacterized protein DNG_08764 [Cephalotrichum gorgonifer]
MTSAEIVAVISRRDLNTIETPPKASISDVAQLSSYNWIEAPTPTIVVPGSPSLWNPPPPRRLPKDTGLIYIAQNAGRHPDSPLEPLFRALYVSDPSFDIRSTDIVSDRNNIRKLLSFVNPGSSRNGREDFTINLEVVENTVIFCRAETKTHEFIAPHEFRGYGHEFEKAYTTDKIQDSTGHHRIISYRFGGLNLIIRHETDGYIGEKVAPSNGLSEGKVIPSDDLASGKVVPSDGDSLSSAVTSLSLSDGSSTPPGPGPKLDVEKRGQEIPLESTLEIKTRVHYKPIPFADVATQLWVSQTPNLVRAYHHNGVFKTPEVEDVTAEIKKWENHNQAHLRKLAGLISNILGVMKESGRSGNATCVLVYDASRDRLVVWKVDKRKMLPEDLYSKWARTGDCREAAVASSETKDQPAVQSPAQE